MKVDNEVNKMNDKIEIIFGLLGGLALFLYGMNAMSDALQKAAGEKMKSILAFLTKNPLMGALAGALVTAILQSSSATTVMAIGFVSAGLMSLPQAISVIFGANIGTTMTAQLLAFKISDYIYPIIFIGFMIQFLGKKEKVKNIGMVILSFGLLFEGIEIMGSVMKPLASSPIFINLMGQVKEIPVLGVLLGLCMTLVVQSSSATIAVLQNFASQAGPDGVTSVIGLTGAIPILFGDNIGTTITALLASIGQSRDAKRTAIAHSIFNLSGTIVFMFFIPYFAQFVTMISPKGNEVDVISRQIANAHTTFNVVCTLAWLPLVHVMVKIVKKIIPESQSEKENTSRPKYLDDSLINQPVGALYLVSQEMINTSAMTQNLLITANEELKDRDMKEEFDEQYTDLKKLQLEVGQYMTKLLASGNLTETQTEESSSIMVVSNNLQRIADRLKEICEELRLIREKGRHVSPDAKEELAQCFEIMNDIFGNAVKSVESGDKYLARVVFASQDKMHQARKKFNKAHLKRVKSGECDASLTKPYSDILYAMERMVDNCSAIAEETMDGLSYLTFDDSQNSVQEQESLSVA